MQGSTKKTPGPRAPPDLSEIKDTNFLEIFEQWNRGACLLPQSTHPEYNGTLEFGNHLEAQENRHRKRNNH